MRQGAPSALRASVAAPASGRETYGDPASEIDIPALGLQAAAVLERLPDLTRPDMDGTAP